MGTRPGLPGPLGDDGQVLVADAVPVVRDAQELHAALPAPRPAA